MLPLDTYMPHFFQAEIISNHGYYSRKCRICIQNPNNISEYFCYTTIIIFCRLVTL